MQIDTPLWRTVWRFLKKLGIKLPYNPVIPSLGTYPEETTAERDMCTPMFSAALFTTAGIWEPPTCPLADEQIKTLRYKCTMAYYSATTSESVRMMQMNLQSEVSQKEKNRYHILTHIYGIYKDGRASLVA